MKNHLKTIHTMPIVILALALLAGCGRSGSATTPPSVGLHEAALQGDLEAVRQHIAAGTDLNRRDPLGGASPLITAATFGHTEVARALIEAGADLHLKNNEGATALHTAAFFCRKEIVQVLLEHGVDTGLRNNAGATALESVAGPFSEVKGIYDFLLEALGPLGLQLDYEHIKATRPAIANMLH